MAAYATAEDLRAYALDSNVEIPPSTPAANAARLARLLARAERDVDRALGPYPLLADGRKLDPDLLTSVQRAALSRATAAQAVHRLVLGEDYFTEAEDLVAGDIRVIRAATHVAPRVIEELVGFGLIIRSGTVAP